MEARHSYRVSMRIGTVVYFFIFYFTNQNLSFPHEGTSFHTSTKYSSNSIKCVTRRPPIPSSVRPPLNPSTEPPPTNVAQRRLPTDVVSRWP